MVCCFLFFQIFFFFSFLPILQEDKSSSASSASSSFQLDYLRVLAHSLPPSHYIVARQLLTFLATGSPPPQRVDLCVACVCERERERERERDTFACCLLRLFTHQYISHILTKVAANSDKNEMPIGNLGNPFFLSLSLSLSLSLCVCVCCTPFCFSLTSKPKNKKKKKR